MAAAERSSPPLAPRSSEMPESQNARCAAITPPTRMIGKPNGLRERCQVRYSTSAMAQAAPSSDRVVDWRSWSSVANCRRCPVMTRIAPSTIKQAGGAEKAADHRVGHIADGAAHPRDAETAQHDAGHDGRKAERDQNRRQQRRRRIGRRHSLDQRRRQDRRSPPRWSCRGPQSQRAANCRARARWRAPPRR